MSCIPKYYIYSQKKWMTRDDLKNYNLIKNISASGPNLVWVSKAQLDFSGRSDIKIVVRQWMHYAHDTYITGNSILLTEMIICTTMKVP